VARAAELDVELLTIHAAGGATMIGHARRAAEGSSLRLLAVTVLTSLNAAELESVWGKELRSMREEVDRLATLAHDAGAHGVVSSALEAEAIKRRFGPSFLVVTPGIRPAGTAVGDQVRTATPAAAVRAGADFLVIGRPIIEADDPAAVVGPFSPTSTARARWRDEAANRAARVRSCGCVRAGTRRRTGARRCDQPRHQRMGARRRRNHRLAACRSGISLDVDGRAVGPLPARQAGAVLRRVFDGLETADARPGRHAHAGGSPQRAFSQIAWTTRVRGTSIGEQTTVFIAYVREDGGWRINQIRLVK
jgi:hypothetical protein